MINNTASCVSSDDLRSLRCVSKEASAASLTCGSAPALTGIRLVVEIEMRCSERY